MGVKIPATGTGDTTPVVATEKIAGTDFQFMKLVDGTVGGSQGAVVDASGRLSVTVANFPSTQGASIANLPAVQPVAGYVGASVTDFPNLFGASVSNQPPVTLASVTTQVGASISNWPATQPVSGYLGASIAGGYAGASVANFPAVQQISGYVGASVAGGYVGASVAGGFAGASVANFPATQPVSGYLGASLAGGYVGASIANTPPVSIASYSVTQPVSIASSSVQVGASISNFPSAQTVVGSVTTFGGSVTAYPAAATAGGASAYQFVAGASVNNVNVKNAAGTLYSMSAMSVASQPRYVKLYDKATTPSVGQDIPVHTFMVPGMASMLGNSWQQTFPVGLKLGSGLGFGITASAPTTDKTSLLATDNVILNLSFA